MLTRATGTPILRPMTEASGGPAGVVDALIVTAIREEYDAVLQVHTGAEPASTWRVEPGPLKLDVAFRSFLTTSGRPLRIAVTRALEMGGVAAANAASPLVHLYRPRCLAMCGVCAGRRGDVNLGDVIIADRLWTYDTGSTVTERDEQGREMQHFKADPFTYNLSALWKHRAEGFRPEGMEAWVNDRPRSYDDQAEWLLARLLAGDDPREHAARKARCANFDKIVTRLRERGWLEPSGLRLTEAGRVHIEDRVLLHPDGLPDGDEFEVRVGPIGTGTAVVRDPHIFNKLSERMRKVLGLEMEAAAIGAIAHLADIDQLLVMKGVMDYADPDKSDNFKAFAARASAECLIAFLRENVEPHPDVGPGERSGAPHDPSSALSGWLRPLVELATRLGLVHQDTRRKLLGRYLERFIEDMQYQNATVLAPGRYIEPYAQPGPDAGRDVISSRRMRAFHHVAPTVREITGLHEGGTRADANLAAAQHPSQFVHDVVRRLTEAQSPIIILADPGFGKSMTLRRVGCLIAERNRRVGQPQIPIYIRLGEFRTPVPTPDSVLSFVRLQFLERATDLTGAFDELYREGRLVLLFDGMDEMDRVEYVDRVKALSEFAQRHGNACKMLFACRTNDFLPTFRHHQMVLLPFDDRQMREYLKRNLFRDSEGHPVEIRIGERTCRETHAAELLGALLKTPLGTSLRNPLLLALSCRYVVHNKELPMARGNLFRWFVSGLLLHLERAMPGEPLPAPEMVRAAWGKLAFLVTRHASGTVIDAQELKSHLDCEQPDAIRWGVRAGLLAARGLSRDGAPISYAFVHHRLQEYLTAEHLALGDQGDFEFWEGALNVPRWREVVLHLAGLTKGEGLAFVALRKSLKFPRSAPDQLTEVAIAERIVLAAQVAAANPLCLKTSKVIGALAAMASRGRPTSQMHAIQACVGFESAMDRVAEALHEAPVGWVRRQARVIAAHSDRRKRRDPRPDMAADLVAGVWTSTIPDHLFLIRQEGTRRWAVAFVAASIAALAGFTATYGFPLAFLAVARWVAPTEFNGTRVWPFVLTPSGLAVTVGCCAVAAHALRTRGMTLPLRVDADITAWLFVALCQAETVVTRGPTAAALVTVSAFPAGLVLGTFAVFTATALRLLVFAVLSLPYGWTLDDVALVLLRSAEHVVDFLGKSAFITSFGYIAFFTPAGILAAQLAKDSLDIGIGVPATMTLAVNVPVGLLLVLSLAAVFVLIAWQSIQERRARGMLKNLRWFAVAMGAYSVRILVAAGVLGLISGVCWLLVRVMANLERTHHLEMPLVMGALLVVVFPLFAVAWKLLEPLLLKKISLSREARRVDEFAHASAAHASTAPWSPHRAQRWSAEFRAAQNPETQERLLALMRTEASTDAGALEVLLQALYSVEASVLGDPAASAYWRVVEELHSIQRQMRRLT